MDGHKVYGPGEGISINIHEKYFIDIRDILYFSTQMHPFHHPPDPQTTALESHILDNKLS
jgi:hypothetical protein